MDETDILSWIESDQWMVSVLRTAARLELPDWCISAGFVRSKVWDMLHEYSERTPLADVDVVYYDPACLDERREKTLESTLHQWHPDVPWSVKNQARMHLQKGETQYASTEDALAKYPETCTAVGVRMEPNGRLSLLAPLGVGDLLNMIVRPTPHFVSVNDEPVRRVRQQVYQNRVREKNWPAKWPRVQVFGLE